MIVAETGLLTEFLGKLFGERLSDAVALLKGRRAEASPETVRVLLRLAARRPGGSMLDYLNLYNLWNNLERPPLKPNTTRKSVQLLADFTANDLPPYLELYCAAWGIDAHVEVPAYDSVEHEALHADSALYTRAVDLIVVCLSEHWLRRYFGLGALVSESQYNQAQSILASILETLEANSGAQILVANFPGPAYTSPGGMVSAGGHMGQSLATLRLNHWLADYDSPRVHVVDLAAALFAAGGATTVGTTNFLRAKMAFEPAGVLAATREISSAIAHLCGKSYRAVVTDWDNTLWGGEVAEVGASDVVCSHDTPNGLAYRMVQQYLKGLKPLGVLLAAASRNDPAVESVFEENPDMVLELDDFASTQVSFMPKGDAIGRVSEALGFGAEYMVFLDDNLFELTQALCEHPNLDVLLAGPEPEETLRTLSQAQIGTALYLSEEDLERSNRAQALRRQREQQTAFADFDAFLQSIDIRLTFAPYNESNKLRVLQMFHKTNQFNLTTRRHDEGALDALIGNGAQVAVVSYEDAFGPQGVIAVVVLQPESERARIESWLMSCRVLNRTVERAIFSWILDHADGSVIIGEYIPTEKNGLVRELYADLGFHREPAGSEGESEYWIYDRSAEVQAPRHFTRIEDLCMQPG